jgi:predicted kinase
MAPKLDTPAAGQPDLPRPPESADQSRRRQLADRLIQARDGGPALSELRKRAENLPPGHPSSPWNEDGSRRALEYSPADYALPETRLTDADYATHVKEVAHRLDRARADGLTTEKLYTIGPGHEEWTLERTKLHKQIIEDVYARAGDVPCQGFAVLAGGLGGAGKSTVLEKHAGIDRSAYLTINPDQFKEILARNGMTPKVNGLSAMEASSLTHEESSYLARQLAIRALADGKNVIWDITMSSTSSVAHRIDELRAAGYGRIDGIFVDIPIEVSVTRAEKRHRDDHDLYLAGEGLGGRYLPPEVIRRQADPEYGSTNRRAFETVKNQFDTWSAYDNSVDGRAPILAAHSSHNDLYTPDASEIREAQP